MKCGNYKHTATWSGRRTCQRSLFALDFISLLLKAAGSVARREWFRVLSTSMPGTALVTSTASLRSDRVHGARHSIYGTNYTAFCAPLCHITRFRHFSRVTFLLIFIGVGRSCLMASLLHLAFCPARRNVLLPTSRAQQHRLAWPPGLFVLLFSHFHQHKVA